MVRLGRLAAVLALAIAGAALPIFAQSLQRLTVQSFALGTDTASPRAGVPFTLVVTLRVRERVARIDNLELPLLAELELLGDERRLENAAWGTQYRETITVVAHHAGTLTIGSALLQAIDPRDNRAKQYATNGLTLQVSSPSPSLGNAASGARSLAFALLQIVLWVGGAICAVVVIAIVFRRRRAPVAEPVPQPAPTTPSRERTVKEQLTDALAVLCAEPTRVYAVRVRALVWGMLGASEGATLADVLARPQVTQPRMRALLIALERAAFTYDSDVPAAIEAACSALRDHLEESS